MEQSVTLTDTSSNCYTVKTVCLVNTLNFKISRLLLLPMKPSTELSTSMSPMRGKPFNIDFKAMGGLIVTVSPGKLMSKSNVSGFLAAMLRSSRSLNTTCLGNGDRILRGRIKHSNLSFRK